MLISAHHAFADDDPHYSGTLTISIKDLPRLEDFPAEAAPDRVAADIDFSSDKDARLFRTRLRKGLKDGPNFNGHYNVVMIGCGTSCQSYKVVDINNGKVFGAFTTTYGATFRKDSALIIADNPGAEITFPNEDPMTMWHDVRFFTVEDDDIELIRALHIHKMFLEDKKD